MNPALLNKEQTADRLGMSVRSLETLMHNGTGPRFVKLSKRMIRWKPADIQAWIDAQPTHCSNAAA